MMIDTAEYFHDLPEAEFRAAIRAPEFAACSTRTAAFVAVRLCKLERVAVTVGNGKVLLEGLTTWRQEDDDADRPR